MSYKVIKKEMYSCKCEVCEHEWLSDRLPNACAKCKTSAWNGYKKDKKK